MSMDNSDMAECGVDAINDHFFNRSIDDVDIGKESLPVLELSTSLGRESLGILRLGCDIDRSNCNDLNDITGFSSNVLNQAFVLSPLQPSELKSTSTYSVISSNFSLNFKKLDQFSAITNSGYSNSIQSKDSTNQLNNAFLEMDRPLLHSSRSQFHSLPTYTDREHEFYKDKLLQQEMKRVSDVCDDVNYRISKNNANEEESAYNDSVFLEAQYLSTKFSEGSSEDPILDETDPPALVSGELEDSECEQKNDKEEVFKKVDKLLPVADFDNLKAKLNHFSPEVSNHVKSPLAIINQHDHEKGKEQNHESKDVDLKDEKSSTAEQNSSNMEKSKEILHILSQIFSSDNISEKEIKQGQHLVLTLFDMLGDKSTERSKSLRNISEKSFHSAGYINGNSTNPGDNSLQSNNSSKYNSSSMILRGHSNSFSHTTKSARISSFENKSNDDKSYKSNASEPRIEMKNFAVKNATSNLRIKKMTSAPTKRGPMKATIAIDNLIKLKQKGTPPKLQPKLPKLNSKSSTPIRDVPIMPVAQSTPDNKIVNFSSSSMEQANLKTFSTSNNQENSVVTSISGSSISCKDSSIFKDSSLKRLQLSRRNSVSEDRRSSIPSLVRRSNSLKETTLMKTMSKIRMNITGSSPLRDFSNLPAKDGESKINGKLSNSSRKMIKSIGKENLAPVR